MSVTGAEHYAEAERILADAAEVVDAVGSVEYANRTGHRLADTIALAQVHATLALVGITAEAAIGEPSAEVWAGAIA